MSTDPCSKGAFLLFADRGEGPSRVAGLGTVIRRLIRQDTAPDRPPSLGVLGYREGMPESRSQSIDLVVVGGGIAGLWILDAAIRAGLSAICVEASKLGSGQSVCAQGIIHGGLKYTLRERDLAAANPISEMPSLWNELASGSPRTGPDLSEAVMSSPCTWLWRTDSLASRLGMLGAKAALRTKPSTVDREQRPELLRDAPGTVLRVEEPVFDTRSVLRALATAHPTSLVAVDGPEGIEFASRGGEVSRIILRNGTAEVTLEPRAVVLAAGAGNEGLLSRLGLDASVAQRRPLHMTLLRSPSLPEFHGHCVDGNRTRVTITSGRDAEGNVVWQLGGDLAESGVGRDPLDQIAFAAAELRAVLPDLDLASVSGAAWSTYRIDRAERRTGSGFRPDDAELVSLHDGRLLVAWPTKWALAPRLAAAVIEALPAGIASASTATVTLTGFHPPEIATFPWENRTWTSHRDVRSAAPA
ncbi:MAG: FAD-dependent oxidoreductase [Phycisphaerales bacterium]|nr:FAD-dependent oxidoreductase [Phycisphaerales bacterium]